MKRMPVVAMTILGAIFLCVRPAYADAAFPTIAWFLPPAWLLLIPVILVEAYVGTRWFGIPKRKALQASTASNIASTVAGVPLAWFTISAAGASVFNHPNPVLKAVVAFGWLMWIPPGTHNDHLQFLLGMAIFLLFSIAIEYPVSKVLNPAEGRGAVLRWIVAANTLTYFLLTILILASMFNGVYVERVVLPIADHIESWLRFVIKE